MYVFQRTFLSCLLAITPAVSAGAADRVPLYPGSAQPKPEEKLEVEQVEVHRLMAIPSQIRRPAGRFLLLVINRDETDPDAAFVIDPAAVGDGKVGPNPVAQAGGKGISDRKHRSAALVDSMAGDFDLKYLKNGKVLCKIHLE